MEFLIVFSILLFFEYSFLRQNSFRKLSRIRLITFSGNLKCFNDKSNPFYTSLFVIVVVKLLGGALNKKTNTLNEFIYIFFMDMAVLQY